MSPSQSHILLRHEACLKVCGNVGELAFFQLSLPEYRVGIIEPVFSPALFFNMVQIYRATRVRILTLLELDQITQEG